MLEKNVWAIIRDAFPNRGRIVRVEAKSRAGFPDVIACLDGVSWFIELKKELSPWGSARATKSFPWGLSGPQAITLAFWAKASAPAYMIIGFHDAMDDTVTFVAYHASHLIDFIDDAEAIRSGDISLPEPEWVSTPGNFNWESFTTYHLR